MKRILCLILSMIIVCGCLTACNESATSTQKEPIDNSQGGMLEETSSEPQSDNLIYDLNSIAKCQIEIQDKTLELPMSYGDFIETYDFKPMGIMSFGDLTPSHEYSIHGDFEGCGDTTFYIRNTTDGNLPAEKCDVVGVIMFPDTMSIFGIEDDYTINDIKKTIGEPTQILSNVNTVLFYTIPSINFYGYEVCLEVVFKDDDTVDYIRYGVFETTYSKNIKKEGQ